jgi:hypothetical protein
MPSLASRNNWDFGPVHEFLRASSIDYASVAFKAPDLQYSPGTEDPPTYHTDDQNQEATPHLGNFDAIFKALALPQPWLELKPVATSPPSEVPFLSEGDTSTPASEVVHQLEEQETILHKVKEVRWQDEQNEETQNTAIDVSSCLFPGKSMSLTYHNRESRESYKADTEGLLESLDEDAVHSSVSPVEKAVAQGGTPCSLLPRESIDFDEFEAEADDEEIIEPLKAELGVVVSAKLVTPPRKVLKHKHNSHTTKATVKHLTGKEKHSFIIDLLKQQLGPTDFPSSFDPQSGIDAALPLSTDENGIHVFIDMSNILIGFYDALKAARGINRNVSIRRSEAPLRFDALAFILERGRSGARRVLAGSKDSGGGEDKCYARAREMGYEVNLLERVEKWKEVDEDDNVIKYRKWPKKKSGNRSGAESGSDIDGPYGTSPANFDDGAPLSASAIRKLIADPESFDNAPVTPSPATASYPPSSTFLSVKPNRRQRPNRSSSFGANYTSGSELENAKSIISSLTNPGMKKVKTEQAVDELLHLKMLQSVVDYSPSYPSTASGDIASTPHSDSAPTMVIATGDAAEAEFSDGFLKQIERALGRGWRVELWAWRRSLSHQYSTREWKQRWGERCAVRVLDGYVDGLVG